jgi:hypothetical protein
VGCLPNFFLCCEETVVPAFPCERSAGVVTIDCVPRRIFKPQMQIARTLHTLALKRLIAEAGQKEEEVLLASFRPRKRCQSSWATSGNACSKFFSLPEVGRFYIDQSYALY